MDDLLPSYASAVEQNPWALVARYLPSDDLCSAALVCRKWHEVFTPNLWGSPASHFGVQNDTVYGKHNDTLAGSCSDVEQWLLLDSREYYHMCDHLSGN